MSDIQYNRIHQIKNDCLSDISFSEDAQKERSRQKWKENRREFLRNVSVCQWCGSDPDVFHIHHEWSKSFGREWLKASDTAFLQSGAYKKELTNNRVACPNCFSMNFTKRKTKTPPYRCSDCKCTFQTPKEYDGKQAILRENIPNKPYKTAKYTKQKIDWIESHQETVQDVFLVRYEDLLEEYSDLRSDQCTAICQACHYKEEQTSLQLCTNCNSRWHKQNKELCWDCLVERHNLQKCNCGNGWYSADIYNQCSDCRN